MRPRHLERHRTERIGWLRAAVLGANDGIVSTASLIVGVAAAGTERGEVMVAGLAALVAGAMSMAAGEYVSVSSQSDTENADLARERAELTADPEAQRRELVGIYRERGLTDRHLRGGGGPAAWLRRAGADDRDRARGGRDIARLAGCAGCARRLRRWREDRRGGRARCFLGRSGHGADRAGRTPVRHGRRLSRRWRRRTVGDRAAPTIGIFGSSSALRCPDPGRCAWASDPQP